MSFWLGIIAYVSSTQTNLKGLSGTPGRCESVPYSDYMALKAKDSLLFVVIGLWAHCMDGCG